MYKFQTNLTMKTRFSPDCSGYPADDNGDADCGFPENHRFSLASG